jgi:hypothetical protein
MRRNCGLKNDMLKTLIDFQQFSKVLAKNSNKDMLILRSFGWSLHDMLCNDVHYVCTR